jgi:hypothetical protein
MCEAASALRCLPTHRTRERYLADGRVRDQVLGDLGGDAVDQVDDAGGYAGIVQRLDEPDR